MAATMSEAAIRITPDRLIANGRLWPGAAVPNVRRKRSMSELLALLCGSGVHSKPSAIRRQSPSLGERPT